MDTRAGVRFVAGVTRFDYLGDKDKLFVKLDVIAEERANGTVLTKNSSGLGTIAAHYTRTFTNDTLSVLGYHTRQQFLASFSAVNAIATWRHLRFCRESPPKLWGARHVASSWAALESACRRRRPARRRHKYRPAGFERAARRRRFTASTWHVCAIRCRDIVGPSLPCARHRFTGSDNRFFSPSAGFTLGRRLVRARGSVYRKFRRPR